MVRAWGIPGRLWIGLLPVVLLGACGDGGSDSLSRYWVTDVTGLGWETGTILVDRHSVSEVRLSSSDGRLDDTPVTVTTATASRVEGTVVLAAATRQSTVAEVVLDFTDTTVDLTMEAGEEQVTADGTSTNPWVGAFSGAYDGDVEGTWTATCNEQGVAEVNVDDGAMTGTGTIDDLGATTLSVAGTVAGDEITATYSGRFWESSGQVQVHGSWTNSAGDEGNWYGTKDGD